MDMSDLVLFLAGAVVASGFIYWRWVFLPKYREFRKAVAECDRSGPSVFCDLERFIAEYDKQEFKDQGKQPLAIYPDTKEFKRYKGRTTSSIMADLHFINGICLFEYPLEVKDEVVKKLMAMFERCYPDRKIDLYSSDREGFFRVHVGFKAVRLCHSND